MNPAGSDGLAAAVRTATADAVKTTLDGFAAAAVLALGDVAMNTMRDCAASGPGAVADSMIGAYATDLLGRVVTEVDANGLTIGEVHVSTQLAKFASGDPTVTSPIGDVSVEHKIPFQIASIGGLDAAGALTLHASCALDAATHQPKPSAWGKIQLILTWSTEQKKSAAAS
jgi:hypothetical protein